MCEVNPKLQGSLVKILNVKWQLKLRNHLNEGIKAFETYTFL